MSNKIEFLQLEDHTVRLNTEQNIDNYYGLIPELWIKIIGSKSKKDKCQMIIQLWKKYLGKKLPDIIDKLQKELINIELLERSCGGKKMYSLLYSLKEDNDICLFYEGRNPMDNKYLLSKINGWSQYPTGIKDFYEKIHDGFYHYANRGMGLQPIMFTDFYESDRKEWNLEYGSFAVSLDDSYHMAFFRNSLGIAVSMDNQENSENNAIIWRTDSEPECNVCFWNVVNQLLLYF